MTSKEKEAINFALNEFCLKQKKCTRKCPFNGTGLCENGMDMPNIAFEEIKKILQENS